MQKRQLVKNAPTSSVPETSHFNVTGINDTIYFVLNCKFIKRGPLWDVF